MIKVSETHKFICIEEDNLSEECAEWLETVSPQWEHCNIDLQEHIYNISVVIAALRADRPSCSTEVKEIESLCTKHQTDYFCIQNKA